MRLYFIFSLIALTFTFASSTSSAAEFTELCDGCTSSQMKLKAEQTVPTNGNARHFVNVANITNGVLNRYKVMVEIEPGTPLLVSATPVSVGGTLKADFTTFASQYREAVNTANAGMGIPSSIAGSAFDMINNSAIRGNISWYLSQNASFFTRVTYAAVMPLELINKITKIEVKVPVTFGDGSTAVFVVSGTSGSVFELNAQLEFALMPNTSTDSDGNVIPETRAQSERFAGSYSAIGNANAMSGFITFWYGGSSGGSGGTGCTLTFRSGVITVTCKKG